MKRRAFNDFWIGLEGHLSEYYKRLAFSLEQQIFELNYQVHKYEVKLGNLARLNKDRLVCMNALRKENKRLEKENARLKAIVDRVYDPSPSETTLVRWGRKAAQP